MMKDNNKITITTFRVKFKLIRSKIRIIYDEFTSMLIKLLTKK